MAFSGLLAGCSETGQPAETSAGARDAAANKKLVSDFYDLAFVQGHVAEAADRYIGDVYIQHNPSVADGKAAFVATLGPIVADSHQKSRIAQVIAEGDLVVVHALAQSQGRPDEAIADIFRVQNGKIVEHWDVKEEVPDHTASGHPMV